MKTGYNLGLIEGIDFRVKRKHWLPEKLSVDCIAFGKTLYFQGTSKAIPKHEYLHLAQFHKYGVTHVVVHYLFHLAKNFCQYRNFRKSFCEVPFEKEAREYDAG